MGRAGQMIVVSILNICSLFVMFLLLLINLFIYASIPDQDAILTIAIYLIIAILAVLELYKWILSIQIVIRREMKGLIFFVVYGLFILVIGIVIQHILIIPLGIAYLITYFLYRINLNKEKVEK